MLIPFAGTRRTFLAFAVALALVAALGLRRRWLAVPLLLGVLLALPVGEIKPAPPGARVLYETDTAGMARSARSNVTSVKPAVRAKAAR